MLTFSGDDMKKKKGRVIYKEIKMKDLQIGDAFCVLDDGELIGVFETIDKPYLHDSGYYAVVVEREEKVVVDNG